MVGVREIVSKGLDERIKVKLAVKQPLAKVIITTPIELTKELEQPIMSELNVKAVEIKKGKELLVELDTKLTPELEQEGAAREIMRKINDLRKKIGLTIQDKIGVSVETDSELINKTIEAFGTIIANSVQADDLKLEKNEGTEFVIKEQKVKIEIKKK